MYTPHPVYSADEKVKVGKSYNIYAQVTIVDEKTKEIYMDIGKKPQGIFEGTGEPLVNTME